MPLFCLYFGTIIANSHLFKMVLTMNNDFRNYAVHHLGMNGLALDEYTSQVSDSYISPTIIEERKLNVAQMDVFSRLMMDRIIFLGTQVDDYTANVIQSRAEKQREES